MTTSACDIKINESGTRILVSDNEAEIYGQIYHYEFQDGDWVLLQTLSGPTGNANENFGYAGYWDSDNDLLRIVFADAYGNYPQNTSGVNDYDYAYVLKFNSQNSQYEFTNGFEMFSEFSDNPAGMER